MVDDRPERVFRCLVALLDDPLTALYRRVERDSFALKIALIAAAADLVSASTACSARCTTISRGAIQRRFEESAGPQGRGGRPPDLRYNIFVISRCAFPAIDLNVGVAP